MRSIIILRKYFETYSECIEIFMNMCNFNHLSKKKSKTDLIFNLLKMFLFNLIFILGLYHQEKL